MSLGRERGYIKCVSRSKQCNDVTPTVCGTVAINREREREGLPCPSVVLRTFRGPSDRETSAVDEKLDARNFSFCVDKENFFMFFVRE